MPRGIGPGLGSGVRGLGFSTSAGRAELFVALNKKIVCSSYACECICVCIYTYNTIYTSICIYIIYIYIYIYIMDG